MNSPIFRVLLAALALFSFRVPARAQTELDWNACVREAVKNNPELASFREQIKQSEENRNIAGSGGKLQLATSANAGRSKQEGSEAGDSYSYGAGASQLLFDGGKTRSAVAAAERRISVSRFSYQASSSDIRLSLRNSFIGVLRAQSLIEIAHGILARREQNAKLIKLRYEAGREHKGALLTAGAKYEQAKAEAAQAVRNLFLAQMEISRQIGWTNMSPVSVAGDWEPTDMPTGASAGQDGRQPDFRGMADGTPSIKEATARVAAAEMDLKSARADFAPSIEANADIGRSSSDWPPDQDNWSANVALSLPILAGGRRTAQVRKAESALRAAEADETDERNARVTSLVSAWVAFQNAIDSVGAQRKFQEAARERAKIAEAQYATGLLTFDNWTIIQDELDRAEKSLLEARTLALQAEADWIHAKGGNLENEVN